MQHIDAMSPEPQPATNDTVLRKLLSVSMDHQTYSFCSVSKNYVLSNHNLLAEGVFASFEPPDEPSENLVDAEHIIERERERERMAE